jgi:hypothetical protein
MFFWSQFPRADGLNGEHLSLKRLVRANEPINDNRLAGPLHTASYNNWAVCCAMGKLIVMNWAIPTGLY